MPTITKPKLRIRIYQLEENGGGTDLQKKSSPAQIAYETGGASNDFTLISISDAVESIELEKGVYSIDSMTLTVDGIDDTFFNDYVDPLNEPFVCEIYDNEELEIIFHGPIERKSIRYNPRTEHTTFDILSWAYVLEQTAAAARTVYETQLTRTYERASGLNGITSAWIPRLADDGTDMQDGSANLIVAGDVAVMETAFGEWRSTIAGIATTTSSELELVLMGEPEDVILTGYNAADTAVTRYQYQSRQNLWYETIRIEISSATMWAALDAIRSEILSNDTAENRENSFINISVTYPTSGDSQPAVLFPNGTKNSVTVDGRTGDNPMAWALSNDNTTVVLYMTAPTAYLADAVDNGITINSVVIPTAVKKGSRIRILGKNVYGYAPSGGSLPAFREYEPDNVIEGLFSLEETGIFQYIANTFNYPTGFTSRRWSRFLEWPNNLLESLRLMQNTERSFLKMTPTLDGSSLPRLTIDLIDREQANESALGTATELDGIIEYEESSADNTPRGVRVKPHIPYMIPRGNKRYDTLGFWYGPATDTDDVKTTVPPEGSDVITFTINRIPSWTQGNVWASNGKGIYNPGNYKTPARNFYEFFENLPRTAEILVDGPVDRDVLGNFVSIDEGGLQRLVFVTRRSYNPITKDTTLSGYVGEYTPSFSEDPVAIIDGDLLWQDIGASGTVNIYLSGYRSFHPGGLPLTYEWILDPGGADTVISTGVVVDSYALAPGTHTIRLTVDDGTNSDYVEVDVVVADDAADGESTTALEADFTNGPFLSVDSEGDVTITVSGEKQYTQDGTSIKVDYSLTSVSGPWTPASGSPFSNPIATPTTIYTGLAEDTRLYVRVTLVNRSDGSDSSNVFIGIVSNTLGGDQINLRVETLLEVGGSFELIAASGETHSVEIDGQEFLLIDDDGVIFDLDTGDSFDINNNAGTAFTVDDSGVEVFVLSGDAFIVDVLGDDFLIINESGVAWDIATGDTFTWDINSTLKMTLSNTVFQLEVNLDMQGNNIVDVADITASGTIAGTIDATGGADFGPGAVTSITVVNGIVTAIS